MSNLLGHNRDNGATIRLSDESRIDHMLVLGKTRTGKTTLYENMIRQDIDAGHGVLVLDPHGTLYDNILAYCHVNKRHLKRLHLIDPNEDKYRIGINYFDLPGLDLSTRVRFVLNGLYKAFGQTPDEAKMLLERWGKASLRAIEPLGLTLAELYYFLINPDFREAVLSRIDDGLVREEWKHFDSAPRRDQEFYTLAILDRAVRFAEDDRTRQIFGQNNSIDWLKVMNEGGIVLANLLPKKCPEDLTKILGISILHQIYANAKLRPKNDPRLNHFYVYVDEFSQLMTDDYTKALRELAGFGIHFLLSQQDITDLKRADEHEILFNSVLNNTDVKIVFRLGNYNEALEMAKHIFAHQITGEEVKDTIPVTIPHVYDDTTVTTSESTATQNSWSEVITPTGIEHHHAFSSGTANNYGTTTQNVQRMEYTYEEIPVYRTLEESFHNYATKIMAQGIGEAQILYNPKLPPLQLKTLKPKAYITNPKYIEKTKNLIFSQMKLRSPAEAKELIDSRMAKLLEAPEAEYEEYTGDDISEDS